MFPALGGMLSHYAALDSQVQGGVMRFIVENCLCPFQKEKVFEVALKNSKFFVVV